MQKLWFLLLISLISTSRPYSVVIVPGFGGSVLYDQEKKTRIWPPYPSIRTSRALDVDCAGICKSVLPLTTLPLGDIEGIDVGTAFTYLLTKNGFYKPLIRKMQSQNATVTALPYDFRLIYPDSDYLYSWCVQVKTLLETRRGPHSVVCHSLGGLLFHYFLTEYTTAEWQKKHISRVHYLNVPFGGSPEALMAILKNVLETPLQIPFHNFVIPSFHFFAGLYWCLPLSTHPVLRFQEHWYTPRQLSNLFGRLKMPFSTRMIKKCASLYQKRRQPIAVPSFVIFGSKINTTAFMDWDSKTCLYEDGDEVVPRSSLLYCQQFLDPKHTFYIEVEGMQHGKITDCVRLLSMLSKNNLPMKNLTLHIDRLHT